MKYYLKCNHCGSLNERKSEYMVMCSSCGKKMDNNFTEWKRRNPGRTFADYQQSAGIAENAIPPEPPKRKNTLKSRSLKEKILIVVITTLSATVGVWLGEKALQAIRNSVKTHANIIEREWTRKTYSFRNVTLETPWELQPSALLPVPEHVKQMIEQMESFQSPDKDQEYVKVGLNVIEYKPEVQLSIQGAADGSVSEMKNAKGVSDFIYDEQPFSKNNSHGFIQRGSYEQNGVDLEFINTGLAEGSVMTQVIVMMKKGDANAKKAAERIIGSIDIK